MTEDLSGLDLVGLLGLLKPVPEPQPVSLFPQTVGWLVVGAVLLALAGWMLWSAYARYRSNAYRRQALSEVAQCNDDPARLAEILRRTALAAYPRTEVARLHGADWLAFLDKSYGGTGFSSNSGSILTVAPYQKANSDPNATALVLTWIRTHKTGPRHDERGS